MKKAIAVVMMMAVASAAWAGSVSVTNNSFETDPNNDGGYLDNIQGWAINAAGLDNVHASAGSGQLPVWNNAVAADGTYYLSIRGGSPHYVEQTTGETIDESKWYDITSDAGVWHTWGTGVAYEFYADDGAGTKTTLRKGMTQGLAGVNSNGITWFTKSDSVSPKELAGFGGQSLGIRIHNTNGGEQTHVDNVRLQDIPAPPSSGVLMNSSFETGNTAAWTINSAGLDSMRADGDPWPAAYSPDGTYHLYLRGNAPHYLQQLSPYVVDESETYSLTVSLGVQHTWGMGYTLELYGDNAGTETPIVTLGGSLSGSVGNGTTWIEQTLLAAPGDLSGFGGQMLGVKIYSTNPGEGTLIDNVRLTGPALGGVIPEPAGIGLIGIALLGLRKKRC